MKDTARRNSKQRQLVLQAVQEAYNHPTAEEVYQTVRQYSPQISLGTVYRNLNLLCQMGQIQKVCLATEKEHFDGNCTPHAHFVCTECGCIQDLSASLFGPVKEMVEARTGNQVDRVTLNVYGV